MIGIAGRWRGGRGGVIAAVALVLGAVPLGAQTPQARPLTLAEALDAAASTSEQVTIARAGVTRARGDILRARAARLPQFNGSASYSRTLASQFEGFGGAGTDTTAPPAFCRGDFTADPTLPMDERLRLLERRVGCPPGSPFGGIDFSSAGFGAENTYNLGLNASWTVFTGGRLEAQQRVARAGREVAEIGLTSAGAQLRLDVTQAYFDAQLADQLLDIAQATLAQAEETLRLTELAERVGRQSEFEVLRARVARDNQRPVVIQRRTQRDLAYDRLRILVDLPEGQPLTLTTPLDGAAPPMGVAADTVAGDRVPVRQAEQQLVVQRAQLTVARSQRLPNVSLTSQYGQVAFSSDPLPGFDSFRDNWNVGASLQIPVFTGGRIRGDVLAAQAGVEEAEAQLQQVRELVTLDTRSALAQLEGARATWEATQGTVEQARRAYGIAEIRFREGISTQIELTDARILLEQARTNLASAARDLQVARARVALLPYLPVSTASGITPGANAGIPNGAGQSRASATQGSAQQPQAGTQGRGAQQSFP